MNGRNNSIYNKENNMKFTLLFLTLLFSAITSLPAQPWNPGQAGISDETTDYINSMQYADKVLDNQSFQNCLGAIIHSETVPTNAIELTKIDDFSTMKSGNTYVIRGDFTITQEIKIPSRCNVYVDGSIHRDGNHSGSGENSADVIFRILSRSKVNLIGVNNARLTGNQKVTAVYVDKSSYVTVQGFDIGNMWEGLVARGSNKYITYKNNYVHYTAKRAIWIITSQYCEVVHNFCDMPKYDGVDFDAYAKNNVAFENVAVGAGRWAGFVEEAAADNRFIRNIGIMKNNLGGWQMGWADNGTTVGVYNQSGQLTRDNYFVDNLMIQPREFTSKQGGGYFFAKASTHNGVVLKGMTYFWHNTGYGCGKGSRLDKTEWKDTLPEEGVNWIAELDTKYNSITSVEKKLDQSRPLNFAFLQNYPNPFNPVTTISYSLSKKTIVKLNIYDSLGRRVAGLVDQVQSPGSYKVPFSAFDLPSGVYICSLQTSEGTVSRKMILAK